MDLEVVGMLLFESASTPNKMPLTVSNLILLGLVTVPKQTMVDRPYFLVELIEHFHDTAVFIGAVSANCDEIIVRIDELELFDSVDFCLCDLSDFVAVCFDFHVGGMGV